MDRCAAMADRRAAPSRNPGRDAEALRLQAAGSSRRVHKNAIFAENAARLYNFDRHAELAAPDRFAAIKADYAKNGPGRSNLRYGYVRSG
jgi:hypothetical protein